MRSCTSQRTFPQLRRRQVLAYFWRWKEMHLVSSVAALGLVEAEAGVGHLSAHGSERAGAAGDGSADRAAGLGEDVALADQRRLAPRAAEVVELGGEHPRALSGVGTVTD